MFGFEEEFVERHSKDSRYFTLVTNESPSLIFTNLIFNGLFLHLELQREVIALLKSYWRRQFLSRHSDSDLRSYKSTTSKENTNRNPKNNRKHKRKVSNGDDSMRDVS